MIPISARAAALAAAVSMGGMACSSDPPVAQAPNSRTIALVGANVIDGTGRPPIEQATLVITDGRVQAVGAASAVEVPAGATRVDVSGKTIVPGLINAHGHLNDGDDALPEREQILQQLRQYAQYGVTTVYALGGGDPEAIRVRDEQERGALDRARLYVASQSIRGAITADEARERVSRAADMGVDAIKIHMVGGLITTADGGQTRNEEDMTPEVYGALIDQAHQRGLRVAAHLYSTDDAWGLLKAGVDVFAHSVRDRDVDAAMIAEIKRRNVGYIPTLTRDLSVFEYEEVPAYLSDPFFLRGLPLYSKDVEQIKNPAVRDKIRKSGLAATIKEALVQANRNVKLLADAGVAIAMGTDSGTSLGRWQGYYEHTEMDMLVDAGLTPMQALVAATGGAARVMELDDRLGTLEPGKWADLIVLNADPLADIRHLRQIDSVWIGGNRLPNVRGTS